MTQAQDYNNHSGQHTHTVILWLDNDRNNYNACKDIAASILNDDKRLKAWLSRRNYGMDAPDIEAVDLGWVRETIKNNQEGARV